MATGTNRIVFSTTDLQLLLAPKDIIDLFHQFRPLNGCEYGASGSALRGLAVFTVLHIRPLVIANSKNGESCIFLVVSRPFYFRKE